MQPGQQVGCFVSLFLCVLVGVMIVLSLLVLAFMEEQAKAYSRASNCFGDGVVADGADGVFSCGWG